MDSLFLECNYIDKVKGLQVVFQDKVEDEVFCKHIVTDLQIGRCKNKTHSVIINYNSKTVGTFIL